MKPTDNLSLDDDEAAETLIPTTDLNARTNRVRLWRELAEGGDLPEVPNGYEWVEDQLLTLSKPGNVWVNLGAEGYGVRIKDAVGPDEVASVTFDDMKYLSDAESLLNDAVVRATYSDIDFNRFQWYYLGGYAHIKMGAGSVDDGRTVSYDFACPMRYRNFTHPRGADPHKRAVCPDCLKAIRSRKGY